MFDNAYSSLLEDLSDRGLLDATLVLATGEFGRTPRINPAGGRDHWPQCWTVVLAGGGVKGGQIVGSSDAIGGCAQGPGRHAPPRGSNGVPGSRHTPRLYYEDAPRARGPSRRSRFRSDHGVARMRYTHNFFDCLGTVDSSWQDAFCNRRQANRHSNLTTHGDARRTDFRTRLCEPRRPLTASGCRSFDIQGCGPQQARGPASVDIHLRSSLRAARGGGSDLCGWAPGGRDLGGPDSLLPTRKSPSWIMTRLFGRNPTGTPLLSHSFVASAAPRPWRFRSSRLPSNGASATTSSR